MADRPMATLGIIFLYNVGVVLSGLYVTTWISLDDRVAVIGIGIVLAIGWTLYFRYAMYHRIARLATADDEEPADST